MERGLKLVDFWDGIGYIGWVGIVVFYLYFYDVFGDFVYLQLVYGYVK